MQKGSPACPHCAAVVMDSLAMKKPLRQGGERLASVPKNACGSCSTNKSPFCLSNKTIHRQASCSPAADELSKPSSMLSQRPPRNLLGPTGARSPHQPHRKGKQTVTRNRRPSCTICVVNAAFAGKCRPIRSRTFRRPIPVPWLIRSDDGRKSFSTTSSN